MTPVTEASEVSKTTAVAATATTALYAQHISRKGIRMIRICALSSSSLSILSFFVFIILFFRINKRRRKFRHYLVFLLVCLDFIKSVCILIFSAVTFHEFNGTKNQVAVAVVGWFTVFTIESADMTILVFALHLANMVFRAYVISLEAKLERAMTYLVPNRKNNRILSKYKCEYNFFVVSILFGAMFSSISFYIPHVYQEYIYWAFFRAWTVSWYFSWTLRHIVIVLILAIYISIYVYVMMQFKKVSRSLKRNNGNENENGDEDEREDEASETNRNAFRTTFEDSVWYKMWKFMTMLIFPDVKISAKLYGHGLTKEEDFENIEKIKNDSVNEHYMDGSILTSVNGEMAMGSSNMINFQNDEITKQIQTFLYDEAIEKFNKRKSVIMKQMKLIFIYPLSFIFLWLFPFINHYQVVRNGYKTLWTTAPCAFFQSLNCFVDVTVFMIREKPWAMIREEQQDCEDDISLHDYLPNDEENFRRDDDKAMCGHSDDTHLDSSYSESNNDDDISLIDFLNTHKKPTKVNSHSTTSCRKCSLVVEEAVEGDQNETGNEDRNADGTAIEHEGENEDEVDIMTFLRMGPSSNVKKM